MAERTPSENDLRPNRFLRKKGLTGGRPNIVNPPEDENEEIKYPKMLDEMTKGGMTKDLNKKTHMMPSGKTMKGKKHKDVKKASLGALIGIGADNLLKKSETARSLTKNLGIGGNLLGSYYDKKADTRDKTTGGKQTGQVTAKREGGEVVVGKGKDYIKDLI
jgi:hypothetical protein